MMSHPDNFSSFYNEKLLDFDLRLAYYGYQQFKPFFKGKTCLEMGPATGYMTKYLLNDFEKVTAVEGSLQLLNQIPHNNKLEKVHSLFEEYNPEEKFDTIVMSHVLEHIQDPVSLLKRIKQWMKPESVFILAVPNAKSFHRLAAVEMGLLANEYVLNERDKALGHYRVYDMNALINDAKAAGLNLITTGGIFIKFLSNAQMEKSLDFSILDAYFKLSDMFKENSAEIFLILSL